MPVFIGYIIAALAGAIGEFAARWLIAIGVGFVTYQGTDYLTDTLKTDAFAVLGSLGPAALQLVGVLQIGTCINIIFSALAMKLAFNGVKNGSVTKRVTKV